jgi:alkanesulfonate monooxygenase SsuD/methylene tetrahydromethanopterin reductase-like flavin-dependent oxidoreductase (luciferase family)
MTDMTSRPSPRFGIVILPEHRWADAQRMWQHAEELGFDHAWTYDHLGWRDLVDGPWFDAMSTLTAAAQVTTTMRLGTLVASANFRHPVAFARQITTLDDISKGRFILGVGAGGLGFDSAVLGQPALTGKARIDRYAEFVELLDSVLSRDSTTWSGAYYTAVDARSTPGPFQRRIPYVVAGNAPRSIALAARFGDGWVTTGGSKDGIDAWWSAVAVNNERFTEALASANRDPGSASRYLSLDAGPAYSLTSVDAFADAVGRAQELGFTDVISHWPRPNGWYAGSEATLETVAAEFVARR